LRPLSVVIFLSQQTLLHGITHFTQSEDGKGGHTPLLFRVECLIERLPRIGKLLKIGCSLSQGIRAAIQEAYRITVAQGFHWTVVGPLAYRLYDLCDAGLPVFGSGPNCFLDRGPIFRLVRCRLQRAFDKIDPKVGQGVPVRSA